MKIPSEFTSEERLAAGWINLMARDEPEGLNALYTLYHRSVLTMIAAITGDEGAAEEILQDTFTRAYQKASRYDPEMGTPFAWLGTIARRLAIDWLRRQKRRPEILPGEREQLSDLGDKDSLDGNSNVYQEVEGLWIREILEKLSPSQQEVIELAFLRGYTHNEIAKALDRPLGTVKSDLRRGLLQLRKTYSEEND